MNECDVSTLRSGKVDLTLGVAGSDERCRLLMYCQHVRLGLGVLRVKESNSKGQTREEDGLYRDMRQMA